MEQIELAQKIEVTQNRMASTVMEYALFGNESTVAQLDVEIENESADAKALIEQNVFYYF